MEKIKPILLLIACAISQSLFSQVRISGSTDASLMRSLKKNQQYWGYCQSIFVDWHFTNKGGAYASLSYCSNGSFTNQLTATAKDSTTSPQGISFTNKAQLRLQQISVGFKHYFVGTTDAEVNWSLYTITGFGLMFGRVKNTYSASIDTSLYNAPQQPISGSGHFKRLTLDLGLGWEIPLNADVFLSVNGKVWIPTSDYPSKYLFVNDNAPLVGMVGLGLRFLF